RLRPSYEDSTIHQRGRIDAYEGAQERAVDSAAREQSTMPVNRSAEDYGFDMRHDVPPAEAARTRRLSRGQRHDLGRLHVRAGRRGGLPLRARDRRVDEADELRWVERLQDEPRGKCFLGRQDAA